MFLLALALRKIKENAWLIFCLLFGLIISIAIISSIPMYSEGILQRFLTKELEEYQRRENKYTGLFEIGFSANDINMLQVLKELKSNKEDVMENDSVKEHFNRRLEQFKVIDGFSANSIKKLIKLPLEIQTANYALEPRRIVPDGIKDRTNLENRFATISSITGLENHIRLIDGRFPKKEPDGGVYEVLVSEWGLKQLNVVKDQVLNLEDVSAFGREPIKIKPVGVFIVDAGNDPIWYSYNPETYLDKTFLMDESLLMKEFIYKYPCLVYSATWSYVFDYHAITVKNLSGLMAVHENIKRTLTSKDKFINLASPYVSIIGSYTEKSGRLKRMLLVLYVPVIIMLFLYVFMVSQLIINQERNEIALLTSRGANRLQIVSIYLTEGLILGGIAYIAGPFIGMAFGKLLGSSSGFLEFTRRKALAIDFSSTVYIYAAATVLFLLVTMLIPAFAASKTSIVGHKQSLAKQSGKSLWQKAFLDVIFLLVSAYGYYTFLQREKIIKATTASVMNIQIDPLLFVVPVLFIMGAALLFLRLYPLIVSLIYMAGRKLWPPSMYITLVQVGRKFKDYHFLVVFIVMTMSTGIFSATGARTINRNGEEKIKYSIGADMVLTSSWQDDSVKGGDMEGNGSGNSSGANNKKINYLEPNFANYAQLPGVQSATRVFVKDNVSSEFNAKSSNNISIMGIEPYAFGNIAWFRNGLLQHHINDYLNLLTQEPSACLISRSLSKESGLKPGDSIQIGWWAGEKAAFTVYGIIDYWPSWNPNKNPVSKEADEPKLFVGNLSYIQDRLGKEPYEVWLKLKSNATSQQVYEGIYEKRLPVTGLADVKQEITNSRRDPFLLAVNGVLTLGFIISGLVCFFGFLIYWILSINSRVLQFGILRAMGLTSRKLVSMIAWEQIFTSGAAIISGIFIGLISSRIFVPFFQISFEAYFLVPPFRVISYSDDRLKIYLFVAFMLSLGLAVLGTMITRTRIDQAIKLGEE